MKSKWKTFFGRRLLVALAIACIGILLFVVLDNFVGVRGFFTQVFRVIQPFIVAVALAYLLDIPTRFFARTLFKRYRHRRTFSIILSYILAFAVVGVLVGLLVPQLYESIETLLGNIPYYLQRLEALAEWITLTFGLEEGVMDFLVLNVEDLAVQLAGYFEDIDLIDWTVSMGTGVVRGIVTAVVGIIVSVFMLAGKDKLLSQIKKSVYAFIPARAADEIYRIADLTNRMFGGFISGKIIDSAIIGVICWVFMFIANQLPFMPPMPYSLLISVIIGVTNIIPFFGPFIGAIPSILILLMVNPSSALVFAVFVLILQQFDGNILGPKILGDTTGLPALWVLVAIIVGGKIGGFAGMIWGVPVAAVLYTVLSDVVAGRLKEKKLDESGHALDDGEVEDALKQVGPIFAENIEELEEEIEEEQK